MGYALPNNLTNLNPVLFGNIHEIVPELLRH